VSGKDTKSALPTSAVQKRGKREKKGKQAPWLRLGATQKAEWAEEQDQPEDCRPHKEIEGKG